VAGDRATIEKDAVPLIEFRLGLDRKRERVPLFERVDVAIERNDREVVAGAGARVIVGPQEGLERLVARREVLLRVMVRDQLLEELDAAQKCCGCPLTPRLMAKPRKPLRVSASMSIAISTTCVPAIALTANRVSPCDTRKVGLPYCRLVVSIMGGCTNLSSAVRSASSLGPRLIESLLRVQLSQQLPL
jgi:hypothetical protein